MCNEDLRVNDNNYFERRALLDMMANICMFLTNHFLNIDSSFQFWIFGAVVVARSSNGCHFLFDTVPRTRMTGKSLHVVIKSCKIQNPILIPNIKPQMN
jgi:hypothetical protein